MMHDNGRIGLNDNRLLVTWIRLRRLRQIDRRQSGCDGRWSRPAACRCRLLVTGIDRRQGGWRRRGQLTFWTIAIGRERTIQRRERLGGSRDSRRELLTFWPIAIGRERTI